MFGIVLDLFFLPTNNRYLPFLLTGTTTPAPIFLALVEKISLSLPDSDLPATAFKVSDHF